MNILGVTLKAAEWVWHTSLAAAVIVVCIAVAELLCGRILPARARLALWWLVVIRLVLPGVPGSSFSVANLPIAMGAPYERVSATTSAVAPSSAVPLAQSPRSFKSTRTPSAEHLPTWRGFVATLWLSGAIACLFAVVVHHWKLARWVRRQPPHEPSRELLHRCAAGLGVTRSVEIIATSSLAVPAVFGIRRPRILIPVQLLESLDEAQLRLVILHELVHIKRNDVLQNWLLIVLQSVHWFNPAIWFAFRQLRAERELVCDRGVLKRLTGEGREAYGTLLIKLAELSTARPAMPTLVPILNHKKHIERRIRMIPKFKVVSAWTAIASALAVAAFACAVLTGAAERQSPEKTTDTPTAVSPIAVAKQEAAKSREHALEQMSLELDRLSVMIHEKQREVDKMKEVLGISGVDEADKPDPDTLRKMEGLRVEGQAEHEKLSSLYRSLTNLSRPELIRTLPNALPDQLLTKLLEQLSSVEQQYAEAIEAFGNDHPEVKKRKRVLEAINRQIQDRVEGILQGVRVRAESLGASVSRLAKDVDSAKDVQIRRSIEQRPYFRAKRELENLQNIYDQVYRRVLELKIDAKLTPEPPAK